MKKIHEAYHKPIRPERVIQFGEGGFLRGFADWMLQKLNDSGKWEGSAVVVQPLPSGLCNQLSAQNCLYTHVMRGLENGVPTVKQDVINVISRCINPYDDYQTYLALARQPEIRFVISNTTEAGIAYEATERPSDTASKSFPAKVTALLYERFCAGLPGWIFLPCELIEQNGAKLKEIILHHAADWNLETEFMQWVESENQFCSTLVDRIVTGYPREEHFELNYEDNMLNTSELFHLWVIQGSASLSRELPLDEAGLNVVWTNDLTPYRTRKVRILNGAHTSMVPYAMLRGFDTVKACMDDPHMLSYIKRCVFDEIIPTLDLDHEELTGYANDVLERFSNPYIRHYLSSIALNSVSKYRVRVLPSLREFQQKYHKTPPTLLTALAALLAFYKTDMANDAPAVMEFMKTADTKAILANTQLWGEDLSDLFEEVQACDVAYSSGR